VSIVAVVAVLLLIAVVFPLVLHRMARRVPPRAEAWHQQPAAFGEPPPAMSRRAVRARWIGLAVLWVIAVATGVSGSKWVFALYLGWLVALVIYASLHIWPRRSN
jgi:uncharacterized MAPEG superfamily protein